MCVAACSEWSECASRVSTGGQRALRAAGHRPPRTENHRLAPTDRPAGAKKLRWKEAGWQQAAQTIPRAGGRL